MLFAYQRTIRLADTDAARVVYFASVLVMCHEAYEESLAAEGINWHDLVTDAEIAIPIVHSSVDFFRPMFCGDKILIELQPIQLSESEFEINYQIFNVSSQKKLAKAITRHACINPTNRSRIEIPARIRKWLI